MPLLTTLQQLLVVSAAAWAISPRWGGFAFAASWVLLWLGSRNRTARAAKVLEANVRTLSALAPEALEHARTYPLAYVWPTTAERWGTTWQMSGLLSAILGGVFGAWALFTFTLWYLIFLVPLAATFLTGGAMARRIKVAERVKEDLQALRPLHDRISTVLGLKLTLGQWPPEPAPDLPPPPAPKAPTPPP
jgi:hypothetical protein